MRSFHQIGNNIDQRRSDTSESNLGRTLKVNSIFLKEKNEKKTVIDNSSPIFNINFNSSTNFTINNIATKNTIKRQLQSDYEVSSKTSKIVKSDSSATLFEVQ